MNGYQLKSILDFQCFIQCEAMKIFVYILHIVVFVNSIAASWIHHGKPPWYTDYEEEYVYNQYEEIQAYEIAEIEELQKKINSPELDEPLDKYEKVYADDITPLLRTLAIYRRKLQRLGLYPIVSDSGLRYFPSSSDSFEIADEYDEQIYELLNRPKKPKRFKNGYRPSKKTQKVKETQTLTNKPSNYRLEKFPDNSYRPSASNYHPAQPYREPYYETERPIIEIIPPAKTSKAAPIPTSTTSTQSGIYGGQTTRYTSTIPSIPYFTTEKSIEKKQTTQPSGSYNGLETETIKYPQKSTEKPSNTKPTTSYTSTVIWTEAPHTTTYGLSSTAFNAGIHSSYESNLIGPYFKEESTKIPYRKIESNEQSGDDDEIQNQITNENRTETKTEEFVELINHKTTESFGLTVSELQNTSRDRPPEIAVTPPNIIIEGGTDFVKVIDNTTVIPTFEASSVEHVPQNEGIDSTMNPDGRRFEGLIGAIIDMIGGETERVEQSTDPERVTEDELLLVETEASALQTGESVPDNIESTIEVKPLLTNLDTLETTTYIVDTTTKLPTTTTMATFTLFPLQINFPTLWPISLPTLVTTQMALTTESYLDSLEPILQETTVENELKVVQRAEDQPTSTENNRDDVETSTIAYGQIDVSTAPYEGLSFSIDNFYERTTQSSLNMLTYTEVPIKYNSQEQLNESTQQKVATTAHYETSVLTDSPITPPYQKQPTTTTQVPMSFLDLQTADQLQTDNPSVSAQKYTESIEYYGSTTDSTAADVPSSSLTEGSTDSDKMITTTKPYDWDIDPKTENGRGFKGDSLKFLIENALPPPRRSDILIEDDDYTDYEENSIAVGK